MLLVPALVLWSMAIIRLPAAFDPRRAHLFRATVFAAAACTLHIAPIYYAVDPALGGHNTVGLVTILLLLMGFWQFRAAILLADLSDNIARRRHRLGVGNMSMAVAGTAVTYGFLISHVDRTDQNLPITYGDQLGMQIFLWTGSLFILWACIDIIRILRHQSGTLLVKTYRLGFLMMGLGIAAFCLALADRLLSGLVTASHGPGGSPLTFLNALNGVAETTAVMLVGLGVVLPRLGKPAKRIQRNLRARWLLAEFRPMWQRVTDGSNGVVLNRRGISPFDFLAAQPLLRLHRRMIEVRDCEFTRPERPLEPKTVTLLRHIEDVLTGH